jgi:hypothetical protein
MVYMHLYTKIQRYRTVSVPERKKKPYNPRELAKNPEIAFAMKAIKMDYKKLLAAKSFSERRGCPPYLWPR